MNDMSPVIVPRSDQISADDFIAGPHTFTIESVEIRPGTEQPVSIFMVGEPRAWRPCKSMSRVLVSAWGPDASVYSGRAVTLYRDPKVKWGGMEVGGIRISHMSHIDAKLVLQLTATKGKRNPHVVMPLADQPEPAAKPDARAKAEEWAAQHIAAIDATTTQPDFDVLVEKGKNAMAKLSGAYPDLHATIIDVYASRMAELAGDVGEPDPF